MTHRELDRAYVDPRLVALYEVENPRDADTDFYVDLAEELDAGTIIDLGCGTGLRTRELAVDGRVVIGVDPAAAMLAVARSRPRADRVRWVEGDASSLGRREADLVVMTGNVAQVFLDDVEWTDTLRAIHAALRPGGHLAFESRNPDDRAWERWNREETHARIASPNGPVETWLEVVGARDGRVRLEGHNVFTDTGEDIVARSELRFRSLTELRDSLTEAGFTIDDVYGDWARGPVVDASRLFVMVTHRD